MDFEKEINLLLEYSDYQAALIQKLKLELKNIHEIYPGLKPSRGWSGTENRCIGLIGDLEIKFKDALVNVPFGISYPINYPALPPDCNILTRSNHIIIPNPRINNQGAIFVDSIINWNSSINSLSVICECIDFLSAELPWFNLDDVFISELWRLRYQIEGLNKDKILLKEQQNLTKALQDKLAHIESQEASREIKESCDRLESELQSKTQEIDLHGIIKYKRPGSYQLLQVLGELEAIDEVLPRLEEAHSHNVITSSEYILTLKRMFYDKFLLQKLKEKIISLS